MNTVTIVTPAEGKPRHDLTLHERYPVLQLTSKGTMNACQYFTHRSWTRDDKRLLFVSNRSGEIDLHAIHVDTGEISRITTGSNVFLHGWAITPDDRAILYIGGARLDEFHLVDIEGGEDRIVARQPPRYAGFLPSIIDIAPDGDTFYMCTNTRPTFYPSNLMVGSIGRGTVTPFFSEAEQASTFFDHQMLCPSDPCLIQINKTRREEFGRGDAPQRMWLLDTRTRHLRPLYKQKRGLFHRFERVCHEAWLPDGKHLCFVVRRDQVKVTTTDGPFGAERSWSAGKGPNFWHVAANPARPMLVADTMWKDSGIWLLEIVPGMRGRAFNVCASRSEWQDPSFASLEALFPYQVQGHPHPGWSTSGRYMHFTIYSAADEAMHVCLVDMKEDPFPNQHRD